MWSGHASVFMGCFLGGGVLCVEYGVYELFTYTKLRMGYLLVCLNTIFTFCFFWLICNFLQPLCRVCGKGLLLLVVLERRSIAQAGRWENHVYKWIGWRVGRGGMCMHVCVCVGRGWTSKPWIQRREAMVVVGVIGQEERPVHGRGVCVMWDEVDECKKGELDQTCDTWL